MGQIFSGGALISIDFSIFAKISPSLFVLKSYLYFLQVEEARGQDPILGTNQRANQKINHNFIIL